jgi:hypothetical protein
MLTLSFVVHDPKRVPYWQAPQPDALGEACGANAAYTLKANVHEIEAPVPTNHLVTG